MAYVPVSLIPMWHNVPLVIASSGGLEMCSYDISLHLLTAFKTLRAPHHDYLFKKVLYVGQTLAVKKTHPVGAEQDNLNCEQSINTQKPRLPGRLAFQNIGGCFVIN